MNFHTKSSLNQINESWHIPRASLGLISQSGSHKSHSTPSTMSKHNGRSGGHRNRGYHSEEYDSSTDREYEQKRNRAYSNGNRKVRDIDKASSNDDNGTETTTDGSTKRGSHSSQGSTASNQSSHSATSGSYLLTAANLEQLVQIHSKNPLNHSFHHSKFHRPLYNANITLQTTETTTESMIGTDTVARETDATIRIGEGDLSRSSDDMSSAIIIDPNLLHVKTKDLDAMSMASSTHFTVVNGMGEPQRIPKEGICSRGHQITVLILTMSLMFLIGIVGAVFLLEIRAKKMPH